MKEIWMCGGGTQSVAIGVLISQGKLPKPDVSLIADTEFEKQSTWDYFYNILSPFMLKCGVEIHVVKRSEWANPWCQNGSPEVFSSSDHLLIPAFSDINCKPSKLKTYCSKGWKVEACERFLSQKFGITKSKSRKWIGFSYDEHRRWMKMLDNPNIRLPLVDLRMIRMQCVQLVKESGMPTPPRSACWMCPNQSDYEWREMIKNRPEEFAKACDFDDSIRHTDPNAWVHKSCIPLRSVDFKQDEDLFSSYCESGVCFL